jgi:hypothetical protein
MIGFLASFKNQSASLNEPLDLYLHGYVSSRLMKMGKDGDGEEGLPITVAATHFDGIVLALTPNSHSKLQESSVWKQKLSSLLGYNYRSAILHGYATPVTEVDEKLWAMERITNSVVADRWDNTRVPPNKTEMTSTQILKVRIATASAKVSLIVHDRGYLKWSGY